MLKVRHYNALVMIGLAALTAACDKAQLLAPTRSTITVSAPTRVLPSNGTTPITAAVMENSGTPVQNGTTVRFTTSLGTVDPVEVQTTNGLAITTFFAGPNSGIAEVRANSGAATGGASSGTGTGTGTGTTTDANVIRITIGAAAVNAVTVRANPGSISPNGGTVELIASVVGENGQSLEGVLVSFNADQGSLSSTTAVTTSSGEARTTLTTSQQTIVTATAGTKTSTNLTITSRAGPVVTITCATVVAGGTCSGVQATTANNTATVVFTVLRPTGSSALRAATLDFGDGTAQALGNLAGGTMTLTHTYSGSDTSNPRSYTATVLATDINGESASASITVLVTPRATPTPISVAFTPAPSGGTATTSGQLWSFTAAVTGGGEGGTGNANVERYDWDFGDGDTATTSGASTSHVYDTETTEQRRIVSVTIRTQDGRTATGRTEILVNKFP